MAIREVAEKKAERIALRSYDSQCGSRCGTIYYVREGVLEGVAPDPEHPNGGPPCPKGLAAPELLYSPHRLKYPMRRSRPKGEEDPGWERIGWEEALETIAARLNEIKAKYGPEAVFFYRPGAGGSPAGDFQDWVFRFAHAFGSPNVVTTGHTCNWHKDNGSRYTYGVGIPYPDYEKTACVLLWGHNPHATWRAHQRDMARGLAHGAKLIVVDPRRSEPAARADLWLQVRPGSDGALALSLIHVLIEEGLFDSDFTKKWSNGPFLVRGDNGRLLRESDVVRGGSAQKHLVWDQARGSLATYDVERGSYESPLPDPALKGSYPVSLLEGGEVVCQPVFHRLAELAGAYPPERAEEITWVPAARIREAARILGNAESVCYYSWNGIEQHTNAMQTNRVLCVLYSILGHFDAPGGNVLFPSVPTNRITGQEFLGSEVAKRRLGASERPLGPAATRMTQSYEVYKAILTGKPYPIKGFISFGGGLLMSNGDTLMGREALKQLDFFAQVEIFPAPTSSLADILLPAATPWEGSYVKGGFGMGPVTSAHLQLRPQIVAPLEEAWPDMKIIFELAKRMGFGDKFWDGDIEAAFDYQIAPSGITVEELKKHPGGITLSLPLRYRKYAEADAKGDIKGFQTPSRRIELYSEAFLEHGYDPLPSYQEPAMSPFSHPDLAERYPLILTNAKLLQYCHGQHRSLPSLRKAVPHPYLEIHPETARELGIVEGDWVALETHKGSIKLKAMLTDRVHPRVVCTQHGWWQACPELNLPGYDPFSSEGANVNLLYSYDDIDPISGSVPYRSYLCRVSKVGEG